MYYDMNTVNYKLEGNQIKSGDSVTDLTLMGVERETSGRIRREDEGCPKRVVSRRVKVVLRQHGWVMVASG